MENFFNYISKPVPQEDVDIWFRVNNIIPEKLELFSDFSQSLYQLMRETYLGDNNIQYETKIILSNEDKIKHFEWCWNKVITNFSKEGLMFQPDGDHFIYFRTFFDDIFYNQKEEKIKNSVNDFFSQLFDIEKPFTKSDLDIMSVIYKLLDKNLNI